MKGIGIIFWLGTLLGISNLLGEELVGPSGWKLEMESTGPFRQAITVTSEDGKITYQAEFIMVNEAAQFEAEQIQGRLTMARCSLAASGDGYWFNVYRPGNAGQDPSGAYTYQEVGDEEPSLSAAEAEYEKYDKQLNVEYQKLMNRLSEDQKADLKERQLAWIEYKEAIAEFQVRPPATSAADSPEYWETAAYLTQSRLGFLKHVYANQEISGSVTGTYVDEYGGILSILERRGDWRFFIEVVRGPTYHLGSIDGVADKTGTGAAFKDWDEDMFVNGRPAEITFVREGNRLQVEGQNTQAYHGARAYFSGKYFKVSDLVHTFPESAY